ncbi:MAG: GNAT family N-acetyltransferase [Betaproteobacteria bacterium]|nr:GNAT family N-acetyltransferase [Betaproteobacteria bacterium]
MIEPLFRHAHLTDAVAQLIYDEFWKDRDGMSVADLRAHLQTATNPDRIPICLVALVDGELAGTVNLIDNDDRKRTHLHPWLAAMVVVERHRGKGIGTLLVQALLAEASRLGFGGVYFGTDGPGFYTRLGAQLHEQVTAGFCIMRFALPSLRTPEKMRTGEVLFSGPSFQALEVGAQDLDEIQCFFEANPEYFLAVGGMGPGTDEARKEFDDRPPEGWPYSRKWFIRFVDGKGSTIGVADVVSDLLAEGVWHIGLFIIATALHGTGTAKAVHSGLEDWIRCDGARWLRLNVAAGNSRAERFWERAGYAQVRTREGIEIGRRVHTMRVMTKPLANGRLAEYLGIVARDRPEAP